VIISIFKLNRLTVDAVTLRPALLALGIVYRQSYQLIDRTAGTQRPAPDNYQYRF